MNAWKKLKDVNVKKINKDKLPFIIKAGENRALRALRKKKSTSVTERELLSPLYLKPNPKLKGATIHSQTPRVHAPLELDIYTSENFEKFCLFIKNLRLASQHNNRLLICFRDTRRITAGAALRLMAEIDYLTSLYPKLSFGCSVASKKTNHRFKNSDKVIEGILQQIGFFKAIGQPERAPTKQADIKIWRQLSGELADGSLAASLLNCLPLTIGKKAKSQLYKGAIEAMANSVDHAYPDATNGNSDKENRWWMLVGTREDSMTLIICDLGVGIPQTLPLKHDLSLLTSITRALNILGNSDAELIRTSTFIKRTRTHLTYRGKGGADIRSITENFPSALLSIRSNRGCYVVAGRDFQGKIQGKNRNYVPDTDQHEWTSNHQGSICGTLVEWTVSLKALAK